MGSAGVGLLLGEASARQWECSDTPSENLIRFLAPPSTRLSKNSCEGSESVLASQSLHEARQCSPGCEVAASECGGLDKEEGPDLNSGVRGKAERSAE